MHCGEKYPDEPPSIQFVSQVNLPCVNPQNGVVDPRQLPCLAQWKRENTMEMVLIELRRWVYTLLFLFPLCLYSPSCCGWDLSYFALSLTAITDLT